MSIEKEKQPKNSTVPPLQEQRDFLLLWREQTPSQKNAIEKRIEAMLEK